MNAATAASSETSFFMHSMNPLVPHSGRGLPPLRQRSVSSSSHSTLNNSVSGSRNNSPLPHESPLPTTVSVETTPLHRNTSLMEHAQELSTSTPVASSRFSHTTPRTSNGKRRASKPQPPQQQHRSSSNSMVCQRSSSTSSFDCQVLQHSLKRVRLSSSPGELRLNTDLKQLTQNQQHHPLGHHASAAAPTLPPSTSTWHQVHEDEWTNPATGARLVRCPVDPLRLFLHSADGTICLSLQVPRMYPHSPPVVTRQGSFLGGGHYAMDNEHDGLQELRAQLKEWWSPVKSLVHALDFVQPAMTTMNRPGTDTAMMGPSEQQQHQRQQQEDLAMDEQHDATAVSSTTVFLPPNRFEAYRGMGETTQWANQTIHRHNNHQGTFGGLMDTNE